MSKGGGTKSSSSSASGSGQKWATPYAQQGASSVQSVFNANQPGLQNLTNMAQNDLVPSLMDKFKAGLPTAGQGNQHYSDILSGKFMNGNPHLQGMLDMSNRDISGQVNSRMANSGRYGSGVHDDVLARAIADNETNMRYQNYATEAGRMDQAAGAAQAANNADNTQLMAGMGLGAEIPYTGMTNLADSLGALFSGGTEQSKSKTKGPGLLGRIASAAGQAAATAGAGAGGSDRRLKTNIEEIGLWDDKGDGLKRYTFEYRQDLGLDLPTGLQEGVMADEVKALRAAAYIPNFIGEYAGVDYGKL